VVSWIISVAGGNTFGEQEIANNAKKMAVGAILFIV
jgi:hypothetical protein